MKAPQKPGTAYRIQEFARLAGVTVRALHHYDRLGLLKPLRRARSGYRLYRDSDLARLEQIVVLKFVGLPLSDIGRLINRKSSLTHALCAQRRTLVGKRRRIDKAVAAIERAEQAFTSAEEPDWELFKQIVKEIEMENTTDWTKKYYSEQAQAIVEKRRARWSPELQERVTRQWTEIYAESTQAMARGEKPDGAVGRDIALRARALLGEFTGGDPEIQKGLNKMWADRANWPSGPAKSFPVSVEATEFVRAAIANLVASTSA